MKKIVLIITLFLFFTGLAQVSDRESITIKMDTFSIKNNSIRAIAVLNDTTLVFAGSNGSIQSITTSGKIHILQTITYNNIIPHFRSIAVIDNSIFALTINNPALLYKFYNNKLQLVYKEANNKVFYDAMQFFDSKNGIAMGDPTSKCLSILKTKNSGKTWYKIPCNQLPDIEEEEAAFAASNTNIAVFGNHAWIATGGKKARVFYTPDKGKNWQVFNTPIIQGKSTSGIYSIAFYNENQGIICGGDYTNKFGNYANKAVTFDGGKTWKVVAENTEPNYISCVQYIPNTQGKELMAVSTNGIFYSFNSGETWKKLNNKGFYSIRFVSKNLAWLSGNNIIAKMVIK